MKITISPKLRGY